METRDGRITFTGRHADPVADALGYRIDGGDWQSVPTGTTWRLVVDEGVEAVEVRSEGSGRVSSAVEVWAPGAEAPMPIGLLAVMAAALVRRAKH